MADLVLLRHGRTEWNETGRFQGHADIGLDELGRQQAKHAATVLAELRPVRLWTSDLARARETAAALAERTGLVAVPDPRLREVDVGERSGLTHEEFRAQYPDRFEAWLAGTDDHLVAGEESHAEVRDRVVPALGEMIGSLGREETGVVVAHGSCLRLAVAAVLGLPGNPRTVLSGMANGAWAVLAARRRGGVRLVAYNRTG